jgi:hypothetical protein
MKNTTTSKMLPRLAAPLLALAAALALPATTLAIGNGPVMTWGTPQAITGDSDVLSTGTLFGAYSFGAAGVTGATVNGVAFAPFVVPDDNGSGTTTVGHFSVLIGGERASSNTTFGSTAAPFSALSSPYQTLLSAGIDVNRIGNDNGITLTVTGLTNGQKYSFEWWTNDSGLQFDSVADETSSATPSGGGSVVLTDNVNGTAGSLGQYETGTFTGNANSLGVFFTNGVSDTGTPMFNAVEITTFVSSPEPGSAALLTLGAGALLGWRRRRGV